MGSLTEKLIKQVEKLNDTGSKDDERFWKPVMDKGGTGSAIIRFLPAPEGCDLPWVQVWSHAFQSNGKWMIDNCLTTLGFFFFFFIFRFHFLIFLVTLAS
jgi:hypothetical protein